MRQELKVAVTDAAQTIEVASAFLPRRGSRDSAGLDLVAAINEPITLWPLQRATVPTGIRIALPLDTVGLVSPRSGMAAKRGLTVLNGPGVVDADYRDEVKVVLVNLGWLPQRIQPLDRIAQLVVTPYTHLGVQRAHEDQLPTDGLNRYGGFGSTGR